MDIQTVKDKGEYYLVNDEISIPKAPGNRDYLAIQKWLAEEGNDLDPPYSVEELIAEKKSELNTYHNSDEVRELTITHDSEDYIISLSHKDRTLVKEQIDVLDKKIEVGDILEADAEFEYYYNGGSVIISLPELNALYIQMNDIVAANYITYKTHCGNLDALTIVEDVENYDFTSGYSINNTYAIP